MGKNKLNVALYPTRCNLCGGRVTLVDNSKIYGKSYGSGKAYLCHSCYARVGTHKPRPTEALGLLANERMRSGKKCCHSLLDPLWQNAKKNRSQMRTKMYHWLAGELNIDVESCHLGYFDIDMLIKAYRILKDAKNNPRLPKEEDVDDYLTMEQHIQQIQQKVAELEKNENMRYWKHLIKIENKETPYIWISVNKKSDKLVKLRATKTPSYGENDYCKRGNTAMSFLLQMSGEQLKEFLTAFAEFAAIQKT